MGDKRERVKRRFWPTHIYDYNYKVSEGYYKPQYNYMFSSDFERSRYSPPKHATYAERFASSPWYGKAYGLPYGKHSSALHEPLFKPSEHPYNASPLLREMQDEGERDIPLHVRASRRRRRFEEEDENLGIRPLMHRTLSLEDQRKSKLPPRHKDVSEKLRNLDAELIRLAPRRSSVTEESYTLPSGTSVHKTSRSHVSHYENSSKPPAIPRARKFSFTEESSDLLPRPRQRVSSVGESSSFTRSKVVDDEDEGPLGNYPSRATKLREMRRVQQAKEITDGVYQMVEKMRTNRLNPEYAYTDRKEKGLRPSQLDPRVLEDDKIRTTFTYNVKRKH